MVKELDKLVKSKNDKRAKVFWDDKSGAVFLKENKFGNNHSAGHAANEQEAFSKAQRKIDRDEHEFNHFDELDDKG